jgi:uncharacterized repeat protein (TIGR03803 family)
MRAKILVVLTFLLFSVASSLAGTEKVLYSFAGGTDGSNPFQAGVVFDQSGNLYGVTQNGGLYGDGTIFQLTPSGSGWTETVLYNFNGASDGAEPQGGLVIDGSGNLYGTASSAGPGACGTVFQLAPSQTGWTYTVLHAFTNDSDGCMPQGDLYGLIYGTTAYGGHYGQGTVYYISTSGGDYTPERFNGSDGSFPTGIGNCPPWGICGSTNSGGVRYSGGTVYLWLDGIGNGLDPTAIINFNDQGKGGYQPIGNVASDGWNMYVTTSYGGSHHSGAVYQVKPKNNRRGGIGFGLVALHVFTDVKGDGSTPWAGVILDGSGNVYGTTMYGGSDPGSGGTVFKLTPGAKNKWNETKLYSFSGGADGGQPTGSIIFDGAGNIYGTTYKGGVYGQGEVYMVTP